MYKPILPIEGSPGYYGAYITATEEASVKALIDSWATVEQQYYNLTTVQCPECRGIGYAVYRQRGQLIRESVGCQTCQGLGKLPRV